MENVKKYPPLQFPKIEIDNHRLLRAFIPKYYLEKQLARSESLTGNARLYSIAAGRGSDYYKKLLEDYRNEENRIYKKRFGEAIKETEKKAKKDNDALFHLIKWDKEWLFKEWVQRKILIAEGTGNSKFLADIGRAVAISLQQDKRRSPQRALWGHLKVLKLHGFNFNNPEIVEKVRAHLEQWMNDSGAGDDHPVFKPLRDPGYFNKFLERHGLKEVKKTLKARK